MIKDKTIKIFITEDLNAFDCDSDFHYESIKE